MFKFLVCITSFMLYSSIGNSNEISNSLKQSSIPENIKWLGACGSSGISVYNKETFKETFFKDFGEYGYVIGTKNILDKEYWKSWDKSFYKDILESQKPSFSNYQLFKIYKNKTVQNIGKPSKVKTYLDPKFISCKNSPKGSQTPAGLFTSSRCFIHYKPGSLERDKCCLEKQGSELRAVWKKKNEKIIFSGKHLAFYDYKLKKNKKVLFCFSPHHGDAISTSKLKKFLDHNL